MFNLNSFVNSYTIKNEGKFESVKGIIQFFTKDLEDILNKLNSKGIVKIYHDVKKTYFINFQESKNINEFSREEIYGIAEGEISLDLVSKKLNYKINIIQKFGIDEYNLRNFRR